MNCFLDTVAAMGAEPLPEELLAEFDETGLGRCHHRYGKPDRCPRPAEFAVERGSGQGDYYFAGCPEHATTPEQFRGIVAASINGVWEIDTDFVQMLHRGEPPQRTVEFLARADIVIVNPCQARWRSHRDRRVSDLTPPAP